MFNRYTFIKNKEFTDDDPQWKPIYNAAPTFKLPVIHLEGEYTNFYWGLMLKWANNKVISSKLYNITVKDLMEKPRLKKAFESQRCIVPADGFYIWRKVGKKTQIPYYCYGIGNFGIAALWESSEDIDNNTLNCFQTLVHHAEINNFKCEAPCVLRTDQFQQWLDIDADTQKLLAGIRENNDLKFSIHTVNPAISNININSPSLIKPCTPADQYGNYTLF